MDSHEDLCMLDCPTIRLVVLEKVLKGADKREEAYKKEKRDYEPTLTQRGLSSPAQQLHFHPSPLYFLSESYIAQSQI